MSKLRSPQAARQKATRADAGLQLFPIPGIREIRQGDDLCAEIIAAARRAKIEFQNGDILVVAQKIVSKSEGALIRLGAIKPSTKARALARKLNRDPRVIEVVLKESRRIVRSDRVLIVETHHGFVCANAGVDHSNVPGDDVVTLLPRNPDRSAERLAAALRRSTEKKIPVIVSDTFGRPWRLGLTNVAIGAAGLPVVRDLRGTYDRQGKPLNATILAVADELASAAGLLMGKSEGFPVVLIRGYGYKPGSEPASHLLRPVAEDLFR